MAKKGPIGFQASLDEAKKFFFDRAKVKQSVDRKSLRFLSRFGAFVRRRSRSSIRPGGKSNKSSPPGKPPRSRTGLLKKGILFGFDRKKKNVVIGPVPFSGTIGGADALEALEESGVTKIEEFIVVEKRDRKGRLRKKRFTKTGRIVRKKIEARPFMLPAFDEEKKGIGEIWRSV